jgi:hypothetical protein
MKHKKNEIKLYDFSTGNAIMILAAYAVVIFAFFYSAFNQVPIHWISLIVAILLMLSLAFVIWYYVALAVTITDQGIKHGKKFIHEKDVRYSIEYNERFRYSEIIFRNKYVDYDRLNPKERNRAQITVQYFPKYEKILEERFKEKHK